MQILSNKHKKINLIVNSHYYEFDRFGELF